MGERISRAWRHTRGHNEAMWRDESSDEEEDDEQPLMYLALAMLRGGRLNFAHTDMESKNNLVKEPCPNKINESDLRQTLLEKQGLTQRQPESEKNIAFTLRQREIQCCNFNRHQSFSQGMCAQVATRYMPCKAVKEVKFKEKNFCGIYSDDGKLFLSACQDSHIRIFDADSFGKHKAFKDVTARDVGWSVLDVAFSSDSRFFAYSSWSHYIHLCTVFDGDDPNLSQHDALALEPDLHSFAVFSLQFTKDCSEILCGANDGFLHLYNLEASGRVLNVDAHEDDINAVCFADDSSNIFYSGGDDGLVRVWDRRLLSNASSEPVGTLAGHQDGITFIDSMGDARYLLSNSKDQSIKLWDLRCFSSNEAINNVKQVVSGQQWDYRWEGVPRQMFRKQKLTIPGDSSVFTYTGHTVLNTLIRARFSPLHSTGNRYIYSGCSTGRYFVYDILTGEVISELKGHNKCVRDVSWHPYEQNIMTSSWEGSVKLWKWRNMDP